jgi:MSHA biogenesis protein MshO
MRPIRLERGVTLIELVVTLVVLAIIVTAVTFFLTPLRESTDVAMRAELSDIADNALQRIGRDVKLALPNSVRVASAGGAFYLEFVPVRTAGRYRADAGGASGGSDCPADDASLGTPGNDQLSFDTANDTCLKSIGKVADAASIVAGSDRLVLNNLGPGFAQQDAYEASPANVARIDAVDIATEANRDRIVFSRASAFQRTLHDSPGKRFFVVPGPGVNGVSAVSYVCDPALRTLRRYWGYTSVNPLPPGQPTSFNDGSSALIAENVSACGFDYANVGPQLNLLTMRLTLQRARFDGTSETVSLYHAVHVNNAP